MPLKPLQQTVDSFEMFTKWLSGYCLFCCWLGAQGDLVSELVLAFFSFFFWCLLLSVILGWAFTWCKDQDKQFLTEAGDCNQQCMYGLCYLREYWEVFMTLSQEFPDSCPLLPQFLPRVQLARTQESSWGIPALSSLHGTWKHNSVCFQICFVSRCHLMVHWS